MLFSISQNSIDIIDRKVGECKQQMNVLSYTTTNAYWMITQGKLYTQAIIHNLNAFLLLHYWPLGICHCVLDAVSSPREASSAVLIHQQFY